jgi:hypothetical protein
MEELFDHTSKEVSEFADVESKLVENAEDYDEEHPNGDVAQAFLVATHNLDMLKMSVEIKPELAGYVEDEHKFQHLLVHTSVQAFYAQYRLLKHHWYNASYRQLRYVYETHLLMQGLNENKATAEEKWQDWRDEAESNDDEYTAASVYDYMKYLGSLRDRKKQELEEKGYKEAYEFLSDTAAHPFRFDVAYTSGRYNEASEHEGFSMGLCWLYAITNEYENTFHDTPLEEFLTERIETIEQQIEPELPSSVPTILAEYLGLDQP